MLLTICRGVSGSGKTTWARAQNATVIERDNIRTMLFGDESMKDEDLVTAVQDATIAGALKAGKDVIVADTNIQMGYVNRLAKIGYRYGATVQVKVFDITLDEALKRNTMRGATGGRFVPEDVIKRQHERFKMSKSNALREVVVPKPYNGTPGKDKAFMVDIDGTLAHMEDKRGPFDWGQVHLDRVDPHIAEIVDRLGQGSMNTIVMSGRDEAAREATEKWLIENNIWFDALFMRSKGDMRPDNIVKAELFDKHVRDNWDVRFVLDDRDQVVEMWRRMGIKCLQVEPGDF